MAEQSQFSRLPKKQLVLISEKLVDNNFESNQPYRDYDSDFKTLEDIAKYFSIGIVDDDYQFFCKFIEINDEALSIIFGMDTKDDEYKQILDSLIIPIAKDYSIEYAVDGSCTYTEYYNDKISAYDKNWVEDMIQQLRDGGNWDYYNGSLENTEYENYESHDFTIENVKEIGNDNVTESLLSKLVLENTQGVVSSLDKETLLKLKKIIDSRLRSF